MRNERFNEFEEIRRILNHPTDGNFESGGPVLFHHGGIPYYYNGEGHTLFIGRSGMGKSYYGIENYLGTLAKAGESFIVPDPKGELYRAVSPMLSKKYVVKLMDLRQFSRSAGFNPLIYPYRLYKSGDPDKIQLSKVIVEEIAFALYPSENTKDPFWENSARSMFIALAELLFIHAQNEQQVNFYNLVQIVMNGEDKFAAGTFLKEWVNMQPQTSVPRMNLQSYLNAPHDTKGSMQSVYFEGLNPYIRSDAVIEMLSNNDLDIESLDGDRPTAIFIILPDETPVYNAIGGMILSQLTRHYVNMAENKYSGKLPIRMNVVIDELASVGHSISNLDHLMAASRSRNIRITAVLQALSQLRSIYGESKADTIMSNFGVTILFSTNNFGTLEEYSKKCGNRKTRDGTIEPLITPVQLGAMGVGQALIMIEDRYKYVTRLPNFTELFGKVQLGEIPTYYPNRKPVEIFDIKEYVKQKKKESMQAAFNQKDSNLYKIPSPPPFPTPSNRDVNERQEKLGPFGGFSQESIDQLLKDIDAKIAALDAEIEEENKKNKEAEKCVWVKVSDIEGSIIDAAKLIYDYTDIETQEECLKAVTDLPFRISFPDEDEAEAFVEIMEEHDITAEIDD